MIDEKFQRLFKGTTLAFFCTIFYFVENFCKDKLKLAIWTNLTPMPKGCMRKNLPRKVLGQNFWLSETISKLNMMPHNAR